MPPVSVHPEADLAARADAEEPTQRELLQLELFQKLKKKPDITKFPQSMVIRRVAKGEMICRQGDAGASAFYILTADDVLRLKHHQLEQVETALAQYKDERPDAPEIGELKQLQDAYRREIDKFERRSQQQPASADPETKPTNDRRQAATAYLLVDSPQRRAAAGGFLDRMRHFFAGENGSRSKKPDFISIDGPSDVDYTKRTAPMMEGDIFGEMSCLAFAPRSATIVADEDCYLLEFLRSIFDQIQKDASYRQRTEEIYRERVLATQFRRMEFFSDVDPSSLELVRQNANLEIVEPGTVICDEGDPSDSVYLIRSGLVQVVKNANVSLVPEDVLDWSQFCKTLLAGDKPTTEKSAATEKPAAKAGGSSALEALKAKLVQKTNKPTDQADAPPAKSPNKSPVEMLKARLAAKAKKTKDKDGDDPQKTSPVKTGKPASEDNPTATKIAKAKSPPQPDDADAEQPKSEQLEKLMADIAAKSAAKKQEIANAKLIEKVKPTSEAPDADGPSKKSPAAKQSPVATGAAKKPAGKASALDALKKKKPNRTISPEEKVWQSLTRDSREAIRKLAASKTPTDDAKRKVINDLNHLIRDTKFVTSADLKELRDSHKTLAPVRAFGKAEKNWTGLDVRLAGRLLLEAIYPGTIRSRLQTGKTPRILAYLSRGDIFGEMGVVDDQQNERTATVIAYDHPPDDSGRRPSRLEVVRIDKQVFRELLDRAPELRKKIDAQIRVRRQEMNKAETERPWEADVLIESSEFRDMGLAQGQRTLLIDLDRCTRCGDCVRACANTHDDGYTRLFLDGPRFDRFLVPSACRSCRNPACMIGCPVGSIQRGDNGAILIRDWCIGCGICAKQCPYDSIQMHDTGLVPEQTIGWQYTAAGRIGNSTRWTQPGYKADGWHTTISPIYCDFDFYENLKDDKINEIASPPCVNFRYAFNTPADSIGKDIPYRLEIESHAEQIRVWINGHSVELDEEKRRDRRTGRYSAKSSNLGALLRPGENVVAAMVTLPAAEGKPVLGLRLDRVPEIEQLPPGVTEAEAKLVTDKAVVCDLCSSLPSQDPACVAQCPHDAAFRIDALYEPARLVASHD